MDLTDKKRFMELIAIIAEVYQRKFEKTTVKLYWQLLREYPLKDIEVALYAHMQDPQHGSFVPKPADFIRQFQAKYDQPAMAAWDEIKKRLEKNGRFASQAFDDPNVTLAINKIGGWLAICCCNPYQLEQKAGEFRRKYQEIAKKEVVCISDSNERSLLR